ncbi:MAG: zinc ABC transporter substrate-binding protein [Gomphosphaeria aponina SAG 52.96 = DSM 107014]|uniref:Zinc ABC transporter substrate-binding protein n=1 Tax=Gomphosphaeria aponina SAG 52.96 = DSM 107014 TaxID=1521640 RepID=A0A941JV01_9CHRO|nr:zinc ABC transporter substrate-binding protein [Gomphosphaeria aponina SAG 52.96 = DSM 107014]
MVGIILSLGLGSCGKVEPEVGGEVSKVKVVSTSTIIGDLTEAVGGEEIEHQSILKPGDDPHVYEPVPADSVAFEEADLILYNGYHLEPGLIKLMEAAGINAKKLAVGEVVQPLQTEKEGQKVPDPHVWGDVKNAIGMVSSLRDVLIEIAPEDEAVFRENAASLIAELEELDRWIAAQIATIPENQRQLVTTHDAFQYYAHAYGIPMAGTLIGISTEEQPSAQTVKNLADKIKQTGVRAIFAETTINPALIETVAAEAGVKLAPQELYSDSIGAAGSAGDTYMKMMVANTQSIVEALGGQYQPFQFSGE